MIISNYDYHEGEGKEELPQDVANLALGTVISTLRGVLSHPHSHPMSGWYYCLHFRVEKVRLRVLRKLEKPGFDDRILNHYASLLNVLSSECASLLMKYQLSLFPQH